MKGLALVLAASVAGCGGSEGGSTDAAVNLPDARIPMPVDAGLDADLRDADRPPTDDGGMLIFGPGLVLDDVRLATSGHSWQGWAPIVNPQFATAIGDGTMILLVELRGLDDPSGQNDSDVSVGIYVGLDTDTDSSNNFSGSASLRIASQSLDQNGNPRALLGSGTIINGHISGSITGEIVLFLPTIGAVKLQDAQFSGDLIAAGDGLSVVELQNGRLSGMMLARHLEEVPNPVPTTCLASSLLDLVALPCLSFDGVQPDVDRDSDGLETFDEVKDQLDGQIDLCTDGNGSTYASTTSVQCVLDPAFQDAFTAIIEVGGVRAVLLPPL
jgi:hypothetical protein